MSLTPQEMQRTKEEFKENVERTGLSLGQIAADLTTTPQTIENILTLDVNHIEDPWILKNYLEETLKKQGKAAVPFTALTGDHHGYWFLNSRRIDKKKLR